MKGLRKGPRERCTCQVYLRDANTDAKGRGKLKPTLIEDEEQDEGEEQDEDEETWQMIIKEKTRKEDKRIKKNEDKNK